MEHLRCRLVPSACYACTTQARLGRTCHDPCESDSLPVCSRIAGRSDTWRSGEAPIYASLANALIRRSRKALSVSHVRLYAVLS